jgi:hypothetical protein
MDDSPAGPYHPGMATPSRRPWPFLVLALVPVAVLVYAAIPASAPAADLLKGTWQREDAEYRLVVKAVYEEGRADVEYLNPKPIHVGEARHEAREGRRVLTVVLQDENYPGSTYTLAYDPGNGALQGQYFQATQNSTFPVSFRRLP